MSMLGYIEHLRNFKYLFPKRWKNLVNRTCSRQVAHTSGVSTQKFITFSDMVTCRRAEARRSVVVQVQSEQSFKELYSHCSGLGAIHTMLHYATGETNPLHFIIVEFAKESDVHNILSQRVLLNSEEGVPVQSNFLWFKATGKKSKLKQGKMPKLNMENGNYIVKDLEIREALKTCESVTDQILTLYSSTMLNDVATRLRFLTARQIELAMLGLFPNAVAHPFGSTVNGFGKMGCDLDIILQLAGDKKVHEESRLVFHCKAVNGYERSITQRHLEVIGDLLQSFLPGCTQVRRILKARVPIIKYYQQLTDVECDLSLNNMSGVCMSDLLYIFGSLDPRVRPLVFIVRNWARKVGLTNNSPGRWVTNFSLTLLVLAFLQQTTDFSPILPTLDTLIKCAGESDKYVTEDGIDCTFLRDITKLQYSCENTNDLESLLKQFCSYYSSYDFSSKAVCLNKALSITKPDNSPLYIVNPLERGLNVSRNVSLEEVEKFRLHLRNAAWLLESQENKTDNWGVLSMFESNKKQLPANYAILTKQERLMEVSRLFNEESGEKEDNVHLKNYNTERTVKLLKNSTTAKTKSRNNNKHLIKQKT